MSASGKSEERIKRFATLGNQALLDLMPLHAPLKEIEAEHNHRGTLMLISTECLGRSQTMFYLMYCATIWMRTRIASSKLVPELTIPYSCQVTRCRASRNCPFRHGSSPMAARAGAVKVGRRDEEEMRF
jgi:hypothetical protein